ncbi:MAG: hypothetical protein M3441_21340 [Chloroflexota bacterium]|nr:hypothetical protein [Chloroflexota bacterium]
MFATLSRRWPWLVALACLLLAFILTVPLSQVTMPSEAKVGGLRPVPTSEGANLTPLPAQETATVVALKTQLVKEPKGHIRKSDHGTWSYDASREESGLVVATVSFDDTSVNGLRAFSAANKKLAEDLETSGNEAIVKVTFKKPIPVEEYRAWAASSGVTEFDVIYTRVRDNAGRNSSFSTVSMSHDPYPQPALDSFIDSSNKMASGPFTVVGITYFEGKIAADRLAGLSRDPNVFLADVTENIIRSELMQDNVLLADRTHVPPLDVFGVMERLGLNNFK